MRRRWRHRRHRPRKSPWGLRERVPRPDSRVGQPAPRRCRHGRQARHGIRAQRWCPRPLPAHRSRLPQSRSTASVCSAFRPSSCRGDGRGEDSAVAAMEATRPEILADRLADPSCRLIAKTMAASTSAPLAPVRSAKASAVAVSGVPAWTMLRRSLSSEAAASLSTRVDLRRLGGRQSAPASNHSEASGRPPLLARQAHG